MRNNPIFRYDRAHPTLRPCDFEHYDPRLKAEDVCVEALKYALHFDNPGHQAWSHTELALRQPRNRDFHLQEAETLLNRSLLLGSFLLKSSFPLFKLRANHRPPTPEALDTVRESLHPTIRQFSQKNKHSSSRGVFAEAVTLELLLRSSTPSIITYPASSREDSSKAPPLNNDLSVIEDEHKIPVQVKYQRSRCQEHPENGVLLLRLSPTLMEIGGGDFHDIVRNDDPVKVVAKLMTDNSFAPRDEGDTLLNQISSKLMDRVLNFGDRLRSHSDKRFAPPLTPEPTDYLGTLGVHFGLDVNGLYTPTDRM